jgi:hypothetical protein
VSEGNHGLVQQASDLAATQLGLERSWLNEAVTQFTSLDGKRDKLELSGFYPETGTPGLRVLVAKPEYLLAMKLAALERATATDRDFEDAKRLAIELDVATKEALVSVYDAYFPARQLPARALARLPELEDAIKQGM